MFQVGDKGPGFDVATTEHGHGTVVEGQIPCVPLAAAPKLPFPEPAA